MANWPATLPQQLLSTKYKREDNVLRTNMDTGPSTTRKRFTAVSKRVKVPMILTGTQLQTFETFWENDIDEGAVSFDWEHPVDDTTVSFKFVSPPDWTLIKGGTPATRTWQATLDLEIQP